MDDQAVSTQKDELRKRFLADRQALPTVTAWKLGQAVQKRVTDLEVWRSSQEIMLYVSVRNETGTDLLLAEAIRSGKHVLLPRCRPGVSGTMDAAAISCMEDLSPGRFGIPEPDPAACPSILGCMPELVIVPGIVFDRQGCRIGYGGGYYDRFLAGFTGHRPVTLGLAYAFQVLDSLPAEPWDIRLDLVCTEEECLWTGPS